MPALSPTKTAVTPAHADVKMKGWKQSPCSEDLATLQRIFDESGVDLPWLDLCAESQPCYTSFDADVADASGATWLRLYKFRLGSGAGIGILVAKKVTPTASERHCALLVLEGLSPPLSAELKTFFRRFSVIVQD